VLGERHRFVFRAQYLFCGDEKASILSPHGRFCAAGARGNIMSTTFQRTTGGETIELEKM